MSIKTKIRGAPAPLIGSKISLKIEKLAVGGSGIARYDGLVVFVPDAAPSDEVLAEVVVVKKNFLEARIVEVIQAGPSRRAPPCPLAGRCGGCNWQHITEAEQLNQKSNIVYETLLKFNPEINFEYLPITPSPRALRYRNRIQPKYKNGHFGFFERNSHKIVDVEDCLICETSLVEKFQEAKNWVSRQDSKGLQRLEIALNEDHSVEYRLLNQESDSEGFSQVNRFQNEDLIKTALAWAGQGSYENIFDLYSGSGNFTFHLAKQFPSIPVIGVEMHPKLVEKGRSLAQKFQNNGQVSFLHSDVENYFKSSTIGTEDLVILDPPRAGTSASIMQALAKTQPKKIIYISCHPVSLARDLAWFLKYSKELGLPFRLSRVQAFEMFPQTDHVETIAELTVDS